MKPLAPMAKMKPVYWALTRIREVEAVVEILALSELLAVREADLGGAWARSSLISA